LEHGSQHLHVIRVSGGRQLIVHGMSQNDSEILIVCF